MCGITGFLDLRDQRAACRETLERMTRQLVHRGPDSDGFYLEDGLGLGFRRLSIIDLRSGDQPMTSDDGSLVLLCNGEIFNYRELRVRLEAQGHRFSTACDVEVLLYLYRERGIDLLSCLNGQFAFVIYDRRQRRLFLARDHVGIAPLFYTVADGIFVFGSEIKALLEHPLVERRVDLTGLDQVLSFPGLVSPTTMFEGIRSLPPGHMLLVEDGTVTEREYWDLDFPLADDCAPVRDEEETILELRHRLDRAVRYRLQADVPVGLLPERRPRLVAGDVNGLRRRAGDAPSHAVDPFRGAGDLRVALSAADGRSAALRSPRNRLRMGADLRVARRDGSPQRVSGEGDLQHLRDGVVARGAGAGNPGRPRRPGRR